MNDKTIIRETSTVNYKVCVLCATFNHAPYITDTMDGFCRQQTDFPFLCVIVDDNSKDGEQEVIRQYLSDHFTVESIKETDDYHLTLARHKDNKNCYFAVFLLKYNHYSIKKPIRTHYQENHQLGTAVCRSLCGHHTYALGKHIRWHHRLFSQCLLLWPSVGLQLMDAVARHCSLLRIGYSHRPAGLVPEVSAPELLGGAAPADSPRHFGVLRPLQNNQDGGTGRDKNNRYE